MSFRKSIINSAFVIATGLLLGSSLPGLASSQEDLIRIVALQQAEIVKLKTLIPAGTVLAYAGATAPSGWVLCDGGEYSQSQYPALFNAIGTTYNNQVSPVTGSALPSPSSGKFRVPDLRGAFLRSVGRSWKGDVTTLGGTQGDGTALNNMKVNVSTSDLGHAHGVSQSNLVRSPADNKGILIGTGGNINIHNDGVVSVQNSASNLSVSATLSSTDIETRPINVGVNFVIKIH